MTRNLLLNLLLATVWTAMTGEFTGFNFFLGFIVGYIVLRASQPLTRSSTYLDRIWFFVELIGVYSRNLLFSSLNLIRKILSPNLEMQSGIIAVPLDIKSDIEITMLANFISLTPGTLSMYVSDDRRTLFIHVMDIEEGQIERERENLKNTIESRIKKVLDPTPPSTIAPPFPED